MSDPLNLTRLDLWICKGCLGDLKQYTHSSLCLNDEEHCTATNAYQELLRSGRPEALSVQCCTGADMMPLL